MFERHGSTTPLIIAGDFNSVPHAVADPSIADPDVYEELTLAGRGWELQSAYKRLNGQEPLFTAWDLRKPFQQCIDYVFASPTSLVPLEVLAPLYAAPPSPYPSDHLPMYVRMRIVGGMTEAAAAGPH